MPPQANHGRHHRKAVVAVAQLPLLSPKRSILVVALDRDFSLEFAMLDQWGVFC